MSSKPSESEAAPKKLVPVQHCQAVAKVNAEEFRAEHGRWNLPQPSLKNGNVVAIDL